MSVSTTSSAPASAGPNASSSVARPRVAVRLEHDDDAAVDAGARRGDDRGDLGRVVAVVVDDQDAARLRRAPRTAARRRGTPARPAAIASNGTPSSRPTATAASAFSRLWRPGTRSVQRARASRRRRRRRRALHDRRSVDAERPRASRRVAGDVGAARRRARRSIDAARHPRQQRRARRASSAHATTAP